MKRIALDANHCIEYVRGNKKVVDRVTQEQLAGTIIIIPPFAYYEVKRGLEDKRAEKQLGAFNELLKDCPVGAVTQKVFDMAAEVYLELKEKGKLTTDENDIYIVAFCKEYGLSIATHNKKHFEDVSGLIIEDWTI